jgi:hypothetical protein
VQAPSNIVGESIDQWAAAVRRMVVCSPKFEAPQLPGLKTFWGNVGMPFYNHAVLADPVADVDDLAQRVQSLLRFAGGSGTPWMFSPCSEWLPSGADDYFVSVGLVRAMNVIGMVAELPAESPATALCDVRRLSGREGARLVGELNCLAYGMPLEWAAETDWPTFFGEDVFSYALYEHDKPASTATVFVIGNCLNVVCVATPPEFQRKGYAHAVMRQALSDAAAATGLHRSVLHASEAGYPLYVRMGYHAVANFTSWTPARLYSHSA